MPADMSAIAQYGLLGLVLGYLGWFLSTWIPKRDADFIKALEARDAACASQLSCIVTTFASNSKETRDHFDMVHMKNEERAAADLDRAEKRCDEHNERTNQTISGLAVSITQLQDRLGMNAQVQAGLSGITKIKPPKGQS